MITLPMPRWAAKVSEQSIITLQTLSIMAENPVPWKLPTVGDRPICVLGAGVLGRRIAACWASTGYKVHIRDISQQQLDQALEYVKNEMSSYKPTISADNLRIQGFQDLASAVADAWLVIECVPEDLALKIKTFAELERIAQPDTILATNSSSYKSREMTVKVKPETAKRMLNTHYFIPPEMRTVELMTSGSTHQIIFPFLQGHFRSSGMVSVIAQKESTGFIMNRVWAAIKRECLMVLSEGVTTPSDLDKVWTEVFINGAVPPCRMMDSVGLDTVSRIEKHYIDERGLQDPGVIPYLQAFIDEGKLGNKSNKGGLYAPESEKLPSSDEQAEPTTGPPSS